MDNHHHRDNEGNRRKRRKHVGRLSSALRYRIGSSLLVLISSLSWLIYLSWGVGGEISVDPTKLSIRMVVGVNAATTISDFSLLSPTTSEKATRIKKWGIISGSNESVLYRNNNRLLAKRLPLPSPQTMLTASTSSRWLRTSTSAILNHRGGDTVTNNSSASDLAARPAGIQQSRPQQEQQQQQQMPKSVDTEEKKDTTFPSYEKEPSEAISHLSDSNSNASSTAGPTTASTTVTPIEQPSNGDLRQPQAVEPPIQQDIEEKHTKLSQPHQEQESHPDDDPKVLMLIRVLFFTYYASLGSLLPYLPVYYHSLGHGGQIIGMLGAIKPFTTFLVAPLWGVVSDQTGSPFTVLYFTFVVSLLGQLMVSWRHDHLWIMVMVFLTAFFNAPVKSLLDSMVMSNLKDRSRYGRLRLWGQLGFGIGSSWVGYLLSQSRQEHVPYTPRAAGTSMMQHLDDVWQTITGYKLLFFTYMMLSIPTFVCIRAFDRMTRERQQKQEKVMETNQTTNEVSEEKQVSNDVGENNTEGEMKPSVLDGIKVLFHNSDAMLFFFLVLVVGISSGVIENFAYVRIREVGGTGKEMGLCRLVSSLAGAPMFWFSGPLTELLGADRVIVVGLINYVVRYFNYAMIQRPLHALPAEALRGMTFAAFWSTCTIYATRIAPPGMQATMLMFLNAMYGGLGQSLGAIIGGRLQSNVGTVTTFLYAGLFDTIFVGLVIAYLSVRKGSSFKNPQPIVPRLNKD